MSADKIDIVGKKVKDMYGANIGRIIGTITDIDGSIQTVGIDCGSEGLRQIPFEQLVVQHDVAIFIPKWRLESQRLLREKELTLRRIKALVDIVSDNDDMKDDASIIHEKYQSKLESLDVTQREIAARLESRVTELSEQMNSVKLLVFDAKVQFKSNEISEETFGKVTHHTNEMIEHITHEHSEIENIQRRISDLSLEVESIMDANQKPIQESAMSYLKDTDSEMHTTLPEVPPEVSNQTTMSNSENSAEIQETNNDAMPIVAQCRGPEENCNEQKPDESDWLARMQSESF